MGDVKVVEQGAESRGQRITFSLRDGLGDSHLPSETALVDGRVLFLSALAIGVAVAAALVAQALTALIGLVTNAAYYGRFSTSFASPAQNHLGLWAVLVPAAGGIVVGIMARYGSRAIRGHGIPEAMEQVLTNESRIAPRLTILKPVASAIAIGTGGPFGAEGPIIATGGAMGSLVGQLLHTTATERKILLAAGAAAGMSAIFGSPVSAVILAIELLLFEFRARSVIPVALASVTAAGMRALLVGTKPVFAMPTLHPISSTGLVFYVVLGALMGLFAVGVTKWAYAVEDAFEHLPIHWMWWPAIGGVVVGVIGLFAPRTLGIGYNNIEQMVNGELVGRAVLFLCVMKLISWSIALGSGTSGGTLAPLFTIGGGLGSFLGGWAAMLFPQFGIDARVAALVGMAAIFAGASRALLTSVVFAFETTQQPMALLPLLGGCTAAYLVSCLLMRNTIMTEKIERRGTRAPSEYSIDPLEQIRAGEIASKNLVTLAASDTLKEVRDWLSSGNVQSHHQGFPVIDENNDTIGVVTRRDLLNPHESDARRVRELVKRAPICVYDDNSLRQAADVMTREGVGRVLCVARNEPEKIVGILTRGDLLSAHGRRLRENHESARTIRLKHPKHLRRKLRREIHKDKR